MQKVLIADGSQAFCSELSKLLEAQHRTDVCPDGAELIRLLQEDPPELLVLDLILPGKDGLSLLKEIAALPERPVILALTPILNSYILDAVRQAGVEYMMLKPCPAALVAQRAEELAAYYAAAASISGGQHCPVSELLLKLGIPAKLRGSKYLQRAITLMLDDPEQAVTKELYPAVGQAFGVDGKRVERCIRNAIHTTWQHCDQAVWKQHFPADASGYIQRPTNAEFISRLADRIKTGPML